MNRPPPPLRALRVAPLRVALVQMCSGRTVEDNITTVERMVRDAAGRGALYVQTPEVTTLVESDRERLLAILTRDAATTSIQRFGRLARELAIYLHIGSMPVRIEEERLANRGLLFGPDGSVLASYDKIHMFDVVLPGGERYRESRNYKPGERAVMVDLPFGGLGMTICYDVRFPALYRALAQAGATMIAVPSAFTVPTGEAHWHTLLRSRAIETQCFVLAAAQAGTHENGRRTFGHSLIVGPWGDVLAEANGNEEAVITAELDWQAVAEARERVPSLTHDRPYVLDRIRLSAVDPPITRIES